MNEQLFFVSGLWAGVLTLLFGSISLIAIATTINLSRLRKDINNFMYENELTSEWEGYLRKTAQYR